MTPSSRIVSGCQLRFYLVVFVLAFVITLVNQVWVGKVSIYKDEWDEKRERAHLMLLNNEPPPGQTWSSIGANGCNVRVATVWVAEIVHRATGQSLHRVYLGLDSAALLVALLLIFAYLAMGDSVPLALGGLLFVGAILPLTYHYHLFHPWDRPSLALWAAVLALIRRQRLIWLAVVLPIAVVVKFDIVLVPLLYFAVVATKDRLKPSVGATLSLLALSFGAYLLLQVLIPGGMEKRDVMSQIAKNVTVFWELGPLYPPLVAFVLPVSLGMIGLRLSDRFEKAAFAFAFLQASILLLQTNFVEVRAEMPVLILLLPAALKGLAVVIEASHAGETAAPKTV
jgi:hypothetical protein